MKPKDWGPPPGMARTPTLSFTMRDIASRDVARRLADRGVFCSHGDFYAMTVVERLGLSEQGLLRAGCASYTTSDEILALVEGVQTISNRF